MNNIVYNTKDAVIYRAYDDIGGMTFAGNEINKEVNQSLVPGFTRTLITFQKNDNKPFPVTTITNKTAVPDSLLKEAKNRLAGRLSNKSGFQDLALAKGIQANAYTCGAKWFEKNNPGVATPLLRVNCKSAEEVYQQLSGKEPVIINLTGNKYVLDKPFVISKPVEFRSPGLTNVVSINTSPMESAFIISGNGHLRFQNVNISGYGIKAASFISSDSNGYSDHYSLVISNCFLQSFRRSNGCHNLFKANKSCVADSIIIRKCTFSDNETDGFMLNSETDNKGYYSAEKIVFSNNWCSVLKGVLLSVYRGGSDESTMGPKLLFTNNTIQTSQTMDTSAAFIQLTGVQQTIISSNYFINCNQTYIRDSGSPSQSVVIGKVIHYTDFVRANHIFHHNFITYSGAVHLNKYVDDKDNTFKTGYQKYY